MLAGAPDAAAPWRAGRFGSSLSIWEGSSYAKKETVHKSRSHRGQ